MRLFKVYRSRGVRSLGCVLLFISTCLIAPTTSGQSVVPLRVALSLENHEVPLHALLKAHLEISNEDAMHAYVVHLGLDNEGAFTLAVKEPDGTVAVFQKQSTPGLHVTGQNKIQPKGIYTQDLILDRWYGFPVPGTYDVTLRMDATVMMEAKVIEGQPAGTSPRAVPNLRATVSQRVIIAPRDEAYLRQQCQQLLETIQSAHSYDDVIQAADALNAIDDPVAASYLTQAAEARPPVAHRFISGLESLATKGAVVGLLKLAKSPDEETKVLARSSLQRLEIASQNGPLKDQIRAGLAAVSQH